nr:virulence-associated protein VapB [uncultured Roseateles sp.]
MPTARESAPAYGTEVQERHVRLFRNGANQAVRIPKEFELPGHEALMYRDGDRLILEAIKPKHEKGSPAALLAALNQWAAEGPIDEEFPDVDAGMLPLDDIILDAPER